MGAFANLQRLAMQARFLFPVLVTFSLAAVPCSCVFGQVDFSLKQVLETFLFRNPEELAGTVIWQIRFPRGVCAFLCGGMLACSGVILQGVLRNPLADPFTLGISAGGACGASIAIALAGPLAELFPVPFNFLVTMAAMTGALTALFLALLLGSGGQLRKESVILAGIAVTSFMGALVALVKALNEESVTSIVFWILGSLQNTGWSSLPLLVGTSMPALVAALLSWRKLDILHLGDDEAIGLGVNPRMTRLWLLLFASLMTAGCVAICGVIAFVGLVVPHILRLLLGGAHGPLLLGSFPAGGLFLLLADCISRTILDGGNELPVGIVTALTGAPFFAFLIWQKRAA